MKPSSHLSGYAIFLGVGVAIGVGAANFFAAGGDAGTVAAPPAAKAPPSAAANPPGKRVAGLGPVSTPAEEGTGGPALLEDISLLETASADREEPAGEPTPEELAQALRPQRQPTQRISLQETGELEARLRQESENANPLPTQGNEGLLGQEKP